MKKIQTETWNRNWNQVCVSLCYSFFMADLDEVMLEQFEDVSSYNKIYG